MISEYNQQSHHRETSAAQSNSGSGGEEPVVTFARPPSMYLVLFCFYLSDYHKRPCLHLLMFVLCHFVILYFALHIVLARQSIRVGGDY